MNCYFYATLIAAQYGHHLPDIGSILDDAGMAARKAATELASDFRWVDDPAPTKGTLILAGPAPDKLHHCGVLIDDDMVTHRAKGRTYNQTLAEFRALGYMHIRYLRYRGDQ